jgi:RNA polymerase sigma-70 factor (ECF subfamily)
MSAPAPPGFARLLDCQYQPVFRFLTRLCHGRRAEAEDLCQETFLRAYRAYAALAPDANHRAWLFTIAYRLFLNAQRARGRTVQLLDDVAAPAGDAATVPVAEEVARLVDSLPERQRTALLLRHVEDRGYDEIAAIMRCRPDAARANVSAAIRKIRQQFPEGLTP